MADGGSDDDHIFVASGDACPICSAMDGELVSAGFRPHESCLCRTKPRKKGGDCDPMIDIDFTKVGGKVYAVYSVEVTCPGGGTAGAEGSLEETSSYGSDAAFYAAAWAAARDLAADLCRDCAPERDPVVA